MVYERKNEKKRKEKKEKEKEKEKKRLVTWYFLMECSCCCVGSAFALSVLSTLLFCVDKRRLSFGGLAGALF